MQSFILGVFQDLTSSLLLLPLSVSIFLTHASSGSFSEIKMLLSSVSAASHPAWVRGDHECREAIRAISCHWIRQMLMSLFFFFPLSPRVYWKYKHVLVPQQSVWKTNKEIKHEGERNLLCKWQRLLQHLASSLVSVVMLFFLWLHEIRPRSDV